MPRSLSLSNGSIEVDFEKAKVSMWATFWRNFRPSLRWASKAVKLRFPQASVSSIARFKWSRWPWQPTYAKRLDQIQTHMIAMLFPSDMKPFETKDAFFTRRALLAGRIATECGRWSKCWAISVKRWHDHWVRAHDRGSWWSFIYIHRYSEWLLGRALNRRKGEHNRTNARAIRAKATRRYFEGHADAASRYL